ncbi:aromatic amino acid lyase [Egibacter rhizosphaerae]|uniref:aromatic amino acid lyase n=1 Tax=Egibacter rhizosphaerae TaxID=1670831 RepID=UPI0013F1720F|nr:aromatic amino acid lyase [Egibacter rhizosphaerae]
MPTVRHPDDLDRSTLERVAFEGAPLSIEPALLARVDEHRELMLTALAGERVYGVTTGMGFLSTIDLDDEARASHQRRLLLGRAVGSAPWLPPEEVRAIMLARLAEFLHGNSGVSGALCSYIADRLNDGFCPAVPERAVGAAGEIQPLAHLFQTFVGVGLVLGDRGGTEEAEAALAGRGVAPYEPGPKEGLALLAGAPAAVGLSSARLRVAERLSAQQTVVAAAACEGIDAPRSPYSSELGGLARDPVLAGVLTELSGLLGDGVADAGHQAPVSFRVVPQVLTQLRRTVVRLGEDTDRRLGAVTDSPAFVDGRFVTSGAFHAIDLASGLDHLALALAQVGELAVQRTHRLLDERVTGLPAQLTREAGGCGLVVVHKRAVGALNELRRLAAPVSLGAADTSLGQEDVQTFTFEAAARLRRVEELATEITACELLCVRQAWWLRGRAPEHGVLGALAGVVAGAVPPVEEDRPLGPEIDRLVALLDADGLPPPPSA